MFFLKDSPTWLLFCPCGDWMERGNLYRVYETEIILCFILIVYFFCGLIDCKIGTFYRKMKFLKNNFLKGVMITDFIFLGLRNHYELNLLGNIEIVKIPVSKVHEIFLEHTFLLPIHSFYNNFYYLLQCCLLLRLESKAHQLCMVQGKIPKYYLLGGSI